MTQNHSIQRAPHNKEHPYCMISMALINDMDLPLFEKGLLIYMLAKPEGTENTIQQIAEELKINEKEIEAAINRLVELGYLTSKPGLLQTSEKAYWY